MKTYISSSNNETFQLHVVSMLDTQLNDNCAQYIMGKQLWIRWRDHNPKNNCKLWFLVCKLRVVMGHLMLGKDSVDMLNYNTQ